MKNLLSSREVSALLGIPAPTIAAAIHCGRLQSPHKLGGSYAWSADDVEKACVQFHKCTLNLFLTANPQPVDVNTQPNPIC
jgi:predicted DNA-binding transcriptional regulator AlpA